MVQGSDYFRIVTWNCNRGPFDWRIGQITSLSPDIAILIEIAAPKHQDQYCCWEPTETVTRGVAVITRNGFSVERFNKAPEVPDLFFPVTVHGPLEFNLLVVWTQKIGSYIDSCQPAFEKYRDFLLSKPSVIAGDFNSSAFWDYRHPKMNHTMYVELWEKEFGLVSSYHKKLNVPQGKESHPTFYWRKDKSKPFHYDYCFVPRFWDIKSVEVGSYENWIENSDHCPLVVDINK